MNQLFLHVIPLKSMLILLYDSQCLSYLMIVNAYPIFLNFITFVEKCGLPEENITNTTPDSKVVLGAVFHHLQKRQSLR